jgi:hypothetical protein
VDSSRLLKNSNERQQKKSKLRLNRNNRLRKMARKLKAVLGLRKLNPAEKVIQAQGICNAMQASGNFPGSSLPVSYNQIQASIDDLTAAIRAAAASNASASDTSHLHEQENKLTGIFRYLDTYVEYVAASSPDPATIITSAGMRVKVPNGPAGVSALTLEAQGGGKILVKVPRAYKERAFIFETSPDGINWTVTATGIYSKMLLDGFIPGTIIHVRYYAIGAKGNGPRSDAKTVVVL